MGLQRRRDALLQRHNAAGVTIDSRNGEAFGNLDDPATEIVSDWTLVMLPGDQGNVGERYRRSFEDPLVSTVSARHS